MIRSKSPQWQFSLAWIVSLVVHAVFVLLLYRAYSELSRALPPTVLISHDGLRTLVLPDLEVELDEAITIPRVASDERRRPDEITAAAPRRSATAGELLAMQPERDVVTYKTTSARSHPRAQCIASLNVEKVALPASPLATLPSPPDLPGLTPAITPLPRTEFGDAIGWQPATNVRPARVALFSPLAAPRRRPPRLLSESTNAPATRGTHTRQPTPAFAHRFGRRMTDDARDGAIERGLEFLARVQLADGRWQFRNLRDRIDSHAESPSPRADAAATGLALLAFLGAGHDHLDGRYHRVVDDALQFLIGAQQPTGEFFPEDGPVAGELTRFYSHGIVTLALCEAFGMTGDERLREPAQQALDYLAGVHRDEPDAWRLLPGHDADSATISWQLATLRCGQLAGLHVDPRTIESAEMFVAKSRDEEHAATATSTAVDLAMKLHLGGGRDDAQLGPAAETLRAHPPELADDPDADAGASVLPTRDPRRDTYYWYYGSEAMFSLGGNDWQNWSRRLYPQLVKTQVADGPFAGSWDAKTSQSARMPGRLYVTAMNLLSLEIENRRLHTKNESATNVGREEAATR